MKGSGIKNLIIDMAITVQTIILLDRFEHFIPFNRNQQEIRQQMGEDEIRKFVIERKKKRILQSGVRICMNYFKPEVN